MAKLAALTAALRGGRQSCAGVVNPAGRLGDGHWPDDGFWYPAVVEDVTLQGVRVEFHDGYRRRYGRRKLKQVPRPGEYVEALDEDGENYRPATLVARDVDAILVRSRA